MADYSSAGESHNPNPDPGAESTTGERSESEASREQRADFARIFAAHDRWLYAYLMSLLGSPADAEEVFQEVCVVVWRDYEKFDPATNFMKWASVIAHNQVHRFRRSRARAAHAFSDVTVDLLAQDAADQADLLEDRRRALHGCLKKLRENDLELVRTCYGDPKRTMKASAELLGKPVNTVYKAMNRIRQSLHDCIDRTLATEGVS
ncbi:MAG: sigma-70 family RNA polymerase sigma factor [Planctomycetota bacterium]